MITQEQIKTLSTQIGNLKSYLAIDAKQIAVTNDEEKASEPGFWNDQKAAEALMRTIRANKKWVDDYKELQNLNDDLAVFYDFFKTGDATENELQTQYEKVLTLLEALEFKNMLSDEGDNLSAVLQLTAGAGGTESCDWTQMLLRMYLMWCEKQGFKVKELNYQEGDTAGVKTVTIEIEGDYAFGYLKGENGVHRLVRISPFDSNAKRHTSFASVYVYPLVDDTIEITVSPADVTWDFARSGGAGGQNVNKVETKAILRHKPTGIMVVNSETRSQLENREKAMQMLKSQLYEIELQKQRAKRESIEANKMNIEFGSQIRNYVMQPYKLVKDVRTGCETAQVDDVMNGEIDAFIKAYLMMNGQKKMNDV